MFLSLRELKYAKGRFIMIGLILVLISWLVFLLSGLGNGLAYQSAATLENMDGEYFVFEEGARDSMLRSILSENLVEELKAQPNVEDAAPIGSRTSILLNDYATGEDDEKIDISLIGIEPNSFLEPKVIEGKQLDEGNDLFVLANDTLKKAGYKIGDKLTIEGTNEEFEIVGFVENELYNHLPVIFTTLDKWREVQFAGHPSHIGIGTELPVNAIVLQGKNIDPKEINDAIDGIDVVTKKDAIYGIPGYSEKTSTIGTMLGFLFAISAFVIAVFFYIITLQKTNQFGVMKAMGASNSFLAKAIISQVFILSVVSISIGIILTYGSEAMFPEEMPFYLETNLVIVYSIILLFVSLISSLASVRRITKIDPLIAIGRAE